MRVRPKSRLAAWERLKHEAQQEFETGHRTAAVMEQMGCNEPWDRARFLVVRRAFIEDWRPANGIERTLIDGMAQAFTAWQYWLNIHLGRTCYDWEYETEAREQGRQWKPTRIGAAEAIEQSAAMADRFNRIFLRTLRALRDLRRYAPVTIQNAGRVNIAGQQVLVEDQRKDES